MWVAVTVIGRLGRTPCITMRRPGTHSATTDSILVGTPQARIRILTRTPCRIGSSSGRYSITAGSMIDAVDGSARKSNAHGGGTRRVIDSEKLADATRIVCLSLTGPSPDRGNDQNCRSAWHGPARRLEASAAADSASRELVQRSDLRVLPVRPVRIGKLGAGRVQEVTTDLRHRVGVTNTKAAETTDHCWIVRHGTPRRTWTVKVILARLSTLRTELPI